MHGKIGPELGERSEGGYGETMNAPQRLARPMLASVFVAGGMDSVRNSESKVKAADARRSQQRTQFLKNLGLLGGLILQASEPTVTRRKKGQGRSSRKSGSARQARVAAKTAGAKVAHGASKSARRAKKNAGKVAAQTSKSAANAVTDLAGRSHEAAALAGHYVSAATDQAGQLITQAHEQLGQLRAS